VIVLFFFIKCFCYYYFIIIIIIIIVQVVNGIKYDLLAEVEEGSKCRVVSFIIIRQGSPPTYELLQHEILRLCEQKA
jgi:hypothetical protein